jgi:hypothetical protein
VTIGRKARTMETAMCSGTIMGTEILDTWQLQKMVTRFNGMNSSFVIFPPTIFDRGIDLES